MSLLPYVMPNSASAIFSANGILISSWEHYLYQFI